MHGGSELFVDYFLLIRLIASHVASDFLLQTKAGVAQRRASGWGSGWLYVHGAIAGFAAYGFAARWGAWWLIPAIGLTHVLIDRAKMATKEGAAAFIVDQALHVVILLLCWSFLLPDPYLPVSLLGRVNDVRVWTVALAYVVAIWPAGMAIGTVTGRFRHGAKATESAAAGVDGGGLLIGRLERFLILTFVLLGHFEAIGFLIAAKSIFRFQELKAEAEYIIIGSMLSFSVAVVVGLAARQLLGVL